LRLLKQTVDPKITGFEHCLIKRSASPSTVHRVVLTYPQGHPGVRSVILKSIAPSWPGDPSGPDREVAFYNDLLPCLDLKHPKVYYAGADPDSGYRQLVLEDLASSYRFPPPTHRWTQDESRCMLRAYARLHARGCDCLPPKGERGWMWQMALQRQRWQPEALLRMVDHLVAQGIWDPLPRIAGLVESTLADQTVFHCSPVTVLHNDVYPPNIALPRDPDQDAVLLDWEMAGWGPAELDLAFMFLQPYRSAGQIDRAEALADYWAARRDLEGTCPPLDERGPIQLHADAVWALSLIPVAHKVAVRPYPVGSAPHAYWEAMFGVLHERLCDLCEGG
jgi:hypothetical protein